MVTLKSLIPEGVRLFDFQANNLMLANKRSRLIAWDMGLGKTYQALMFDVMNRKMVAGQEGSINSNLLPSPGNRKTLVVCPKSVIGVWEDHARRLTDQNVVIIDPKKRDLFIKACQAKGDGIYVCHWEALRLMPALKKVLFWHIIADECHRMKNRKAQQTVAVKSLRSFYKSAMSGTWADNRPQDAWSVLDWLWPMQWGAFWTFCKKYMVVKRVVDEKTGEDKGYIELTELQNMDEFHVKLNNLGYSRLLKKDVLKDLPDKYYTQMWVDLHPQQRRAYDQMKKVMIAWLEDHTEQELEDPMIAQLVVTQLIRLQQFAVGYMAIGDPPTKWVWRQRKGEKFKEEVPNYVMSEPSSKLDALMDILDNSEGPIVVFSQFKSILTLLARRLQKDDIPFALITGDVTERDRTNAVQNFQRGDLRLLAGTIAAGGVGLTLTAASTVVFLDRSWSPAVNLQAEDRLHRIGQTQAVQVIDLMAKSSIDLGRHQKLQKKMAILRQILGDNTTSQQAQEILINMSEGETNA